MERLKALSAILLAAILIFSMMSPLPVCAQSYQPTIDAAVDLNQTGSEQVIHSAYVTYGNLPADTHQTVESAVAALRSGMKSRQSEIAINLLMDGNFDSSLSQEIFDSALTHTGNPTEGDYLRWQYAGCGWSGSYIKENGVEWIQSTYYPAYYTTAAQEAELDMAVKALLDELDLWDASDYDKISGVYGWICQNVTYDYENLEEESYLLKFTAYAALMDRTAVCQGYSTLLYRLLLELGIDNRVISGTGNGGAHAWNIVKLDGLYYNVDVTWDASCAQAGLDYSYFLLPDADFEDHIRDEMYATAAFYQEYPMHEMEYTPGYHEHRYEATVTAPTCTEAGYTTYTCACGHSYITDVVPALGHTVGDVVCENYTTTANVTYCDKVVYCQVCGSEISRVNVPYAVLTVGTAAAVKPGETVTLEVSVSATKYASYQLTIVYDTEALTLVEIEEGDETVGTFAANTDTGTIVDFTARNKKVDGVIFTLTFEVSENATGGLHEVTCDIKGFYLADSSKLPVNLVSGGITIAHDHDYVPTKTAPTCTEAGYTTYTCACGDSYVSDKVAATGHSYTAVVTKPTCTEDGYTTYTCSCGHSYVTDTVKAQGHVPGEAVKENAEGSYYEEVVCCEVCGTELSRIAVSSSALGDLNGDGEVDIKDANLVCSYYNELIDLSGAALAVADVNGDGEIDIKDANLICSYYNEVMDSFPAEQ